MNVQQYDQDVLTDRNAATTGYIKFVMKAYIIHMKVCDYKMIQEMGISPLSSQRLSDSILSTRVNPKKEATRKRERK